MSEWIPFFSLWHSRGRPLAEASKEKKVRSTISQAKSQGFYVDATREPRWAAPVIVADDTIEERCVIWVRKQVGEMVK